MLLYCDGVSHPSVLLEPRRAALIHRNGFDTLVGMSGEGISLRAAVRDDVPPLLAFWALAGENDNRPSDSAAAIEQLIARDPDALIVAVDPADAIVGTVIAGWDGWRAHLYRLAVHPAYRRRGLASTLLGAAEERLKACGAQRLDAMVLDGNALGRSVWKARGYRRQAEWSRWVLPVD